MPVEAPLDGLAFYFVRDAVPAVHPLQLAEPFDVVPPIIARHPSPHRRAGGSAGETSSSSLSVAIPRVADSSSLTLTPRFAEALAYSAQLHTGQVRKTTAIPYVSHLLAVCALVLEDGGGEDEAIAALLHDGPEDAGGHATLQEIRERFGDHVASMWRSAQTRSSTPSRAGLNASSATSTTSNTHPTKRSASRSPTSSHNVRSINRDLAIRRTSLGTLQREP